MKTEDIKLERLRRLRLWGRLYGDGEAMAISPQQLVDLRVYGGARGLWIDKAQTTGELTADGQGVTVAVLHTGRYNDDLGDNEVVYSYPRTLSPGWDDNQVAATRNAAVMQVPVFVIAPSPTHPKKKRVRMGWVVGMDDLARQILIVFGGEPTESLSQPADDSPFVPFERRTAHITDAVRRQGQGRFRYQVLTRYGPKCMLCGIAASEVLETPHIVPYAKRGSNDPRNGLVMCATHHRAFDADLFAVDPETWMLRYAPASPNAADLRVTTEQLSLNGPQPHVDALSWRWKHWLNKLRIRSSGASSDVA